MVNMNEFYSTIKEQSEERNMTEKEFQNIVNQGVVLLDGALGSNLMLRGMPKGVCTEMWVYDHPDVHAEIQGAYADAGSRIIYAPTFQANRISFAGFGLDSEIGNINRTMIARTKEIVGDRAFVAGDISSTGKYEEAYEVLFDVYKEQAGYLADAGADLLVMETMIKIEETMAAIDAAKSICDLPIMCTMTVEADGSLLMGGNIYEAVATYEAMGASAVGINCSLGPDQLEAIVRGIRETVSIPVVVKPNAGIPFIDDKGNAIYSMGPDAFAEHMLKLIDAGANLVGGCCGTNADYIRAVKERLM